MSLSRALVLKRSGVSLFALWTFFACGGRDNTEVYSVDGGLLSCGNGQIDPPEEECDPTASALPDGADCASATDNAAPNGTLKCAQNCSFDVSGCRRAGVNPGSGGRGTAGMMNVGGTMGPGQGGRGFGGFGGQSFGGQNGGGTMGFAGRGNNGGGGTMGMGNGGRGGRGRGNGGTPQAGGQPSAGGSPTDAGSDSGPVTDAGVSCLGSGDCGSGRVCCGTISNGQYTGFSCQANCGGNDTVVDCGKPSDCGNGQVCCGTQQVNGGTRQYTSLSCQATCGGAGQNEFVLCVSNGDCSNGLTCQGSAYLPAQFRVCR